MMDTPYYDLLYPANKYEEECQWIHRWLGLDEREKTVLDLGCGSARHGEYFVRQYDYKVIGIDRNENMLKLAQPRAKANEGLQVLRGDITKFRDKSLKDSCDLTCALFHVLNFMDYWQDIDKVFQTASYHCKPGGMFFFDVWGATDKLQPQVKEVWTEQVHLKRLSAPVTYPKDTALKMQYHLFVRDFEEDPEGDWVGYEESFYVRPICEHLVRMLAAHNDFNVVEIRRGFNGDDWFYKLQRKFGYQDPNTLTKEDA